MVNLDVLDINDVVYLANKISVKEFIHYCQKHVKAFNAIKPGFRPKSLTNVQIQELFKTEFHKKKGLICDFLLDFIDNVIRQINEDVATQNNDNDEEYVWVAVLATCCLSDNVVLLNRLLDNKLEKLDDIQLIQAAVNIIQENKNKFEVTSKNFIEEIAKSHDEVIKLKKELSEALTKTGKLQEETERLAIQNNIFERDVSSVKAERDKLLKENESLLKALISTKNENDELKCEAEKNAQSNATLETKIKELNNDMCAISSENEQLLATQKELEQQLSVVTDELANTRDHFGIHACGDLTTYIVPSKPLRPEKLSDFEDYVDDILEQLGVAENRKLLVKHLSTIFFNGQPIISSRKSADILIKVLSCIYKIPITHIVYSDDITLLKIVYEISNAERIIYLDNFIGHFPETYLIPFLGSWKDKIIIMSATYDMTFKYISEEFLSYASYVNFDNYTIKNDIYVQPIVETISEENFILEGIHDKAEQAKLKKIMEELDFPCSVINKRVESVYNSEDTNRLLLFEILPYISYVLKYDPLSKSISLEYYCNANGYKTIMKWFGK